MVVYTGDTKSKKFIKQLAARGWGRVLIFDKVKLYDGEPWALDNGAYHFWRRGIAFDGHAFLDRIQKFKEWAVSVPDFLVLPDIHRGGFKSVLETAKWLPTIQGMALGWPLYFAVQDGMRFVDLEPFAEEISGLFLGGSDRFKAETRKWVLWGHENGLKVHYGRCSTPRKVKHAYATDCDSLDSAHPLWTKERWAEWVLACEQRHPQGELF